MRAHFCAISIGEQQMQAKKSKQAVVRIPSGTYLIKARVEEGQVVGTQVVGRWGARQRDGCTTLLDASASAREGFDRLLTAPLR
jgi:hypothetical protein